MVHVKHKHFMFFAVFYEFEIIILEDNMPGHSLDIFIEKVTEMVKVIPLNAKNEDQTLSIRRCSFRMGLNIFLC